jgi:uncharacterized protein YjbI with pentapeptide repeats
VAFPPYLRAALFVAALFAAMTAGSSAFAATPPSGQCTAQKLGSSPDPAEVVRCLRRGPVVLNDARFETQVDLTPLQTVKQLFGCTNCQFLGGFNGRNVSFSRELDLAGSTIHGADFSGANFGGPVLLSNVHFDLDPQHEATFAAIFSYAVFSELATFDGAQFHGKLLYTEREACSYPHGAAAFDGARFLSEASFQGITSVGGLCFKDSEFAAAPSGTTSFAGPSHFRGMADFTHASFGNHLDLSNAIFGGLARFDSANFAAGATFTATRFTCDAFDTNDGAATFQGVSALGTLDFANSFFDDQKGCNSDFIKITGTVASLDLRGFINWQQIAGQKKGNKPDQTVNINIVFPGQGSVHVTQLGALHMSLDNLGLLHDDQTTVASPANQETAAQLIGATAKAEGDLGLANDAHYKYEEVRSASFPRWRRWPSQIVYGDMMGYLVRPLNPLVAFLVLAAIAACFRAGLFRRRSRDASAHQSESSQPPASERQPLFHRIKARLEIVVLVVVVRLDRLLHAYLDTVSSVTPGWAGGPGKDGSIVVRLERFSYRFLLTCALVALAASDPSLRQLVQAV